MMNSGKPEHLKTFGRFTGCLMGMWVKYSDMLPAWMEGIKRASNELPSAAKENIGYYYLRMNLNKWGFYLSEFFILAITASIPATSAAIGSTALAGALGAVAAVAAGVKLIFRWRENWILSQTTFVAIEQEVADWNCGRGRYNATVPPDEADAILVRRIEKFAELETANWANLMRFSAGSAP